MELPPPDGGASAGAGPGGYPLPKTQSRDKGRSGAATAGLPPFLGSPAGQASPPCPRGARRGGLGWRRGGGSAGGGQRKRGGNVSSVLGNAAACRGAEGPRARTPALSPCTARSPLASTLPTKARNGTEGGPQGWRRAVLTPSAGPRCAAGVARGQHLGPRPFSSFILLWRQGAAPPPAPGQTACSSSLALVRERQERAGKGRKGQLSSVPWGAPWQWRCRGSG